MSRFLYRIGRRAARHPWQIVAAWLVVAVAVFGLRAGAGGKPTDNFSLPGTETQAAQDLLKQRFPAQAGASGQVVFHVEDGTLADPGNRADVEAAVAAIAASDRVLAASDPFDAGHPTVSTDGRTAFTTVLFHRQTLEAADFDAVDTAIEGGRQRGVQIEITGAIAQAAQKIEGKEGIGLGVAVVVLLVAFGSLIAMGIPIGTAVFGLVIGMAGVSILAGAVDVPTVAPLVATMIGLGVGIDYALFVVTRHRQFLHESNDVADAAGRANATAGQAVLFAGATVVIAIMGLWLAGIPAVATMGFASAITVAVAMLAAVTLLPAFLGIAGTRIDRLRIGRRVRIEAVAHETISGRWAHHVGRRPWRYAILSLAALLALAAPVLALRTAFADDGNAAPSTTQRRAYDLLTDAFGKGFNAPLTVVVENGTAASLQHVQESLAAVPGVVAVTAPQLNPTGDTAVLLAYPSTSPQDGATQTLVRSLRDDVLPASLAGSSAKAQVTGMTASQIDISQRIMQRLPWFIGAVVLMSFVLLMLVFRSVLVPLKAALMNLLSIGAAYGVVVAVFQWGWARGLVGIHETVPVNPFVPMIMFAILFGLSMDYEVFLLSRVREEFHRTRDSHASVVNGLAGTARVITSAALIMISVFGAFILTDDVTVKMFGVGLSVAVLIDATVVRMVLVPATMALLGEANWWLPRWLDRLLPHLDIEGGVEDLPERGTGPDEEDIEGELEPALVSA